MCIIVVFLELGRILHLLLTSTCLFLIYDTLENKRLRGAGHNEVRNGEENK
jgi:hypothetical protein